MSVEEKVKSLGLEIPAAPAPVAAYVPALTAGEYVFTSGQLPFVAGELKYKGKLGREVDEASGYQAARICAVNCLAAVKGAVGDLERVVRIVKVTGFVNSAPGFTGQPGVVNGASELLQEIFGDAGRHARSAVGVSELPLDAPVEVEMVVRVK